ncbi:hypothetical protein RF11_12729 [Thelohanellus kitauei]|uniref:Uncharacterized protein n=1 Tax=Thelohanellus kitauei TaxID=669202 RepID=A0A0C2MSH3_THEKT|nr:hypothetical protein RF11_12729 [Thelohanellus kitauei]
MILPKVFGTFTRRDGQRDRKWFDVGFIRSRLSDARDAPATAEKTCAKGDTSCFAAAQANAMLDFADAIADDIFAIQSTVEYIESFFKEEEGGEGDEGDEGDEGEEDD